MNVMLWVLQGLLALAFLGAGAGKLRASKAALAQHPRMGWAHDFSEPAIRAIGAAEVAGAAGLILPMALGIVPGLTPVAALGLGALMGGAVATHRRRHEAFAPPLVLGILALVVALRRGRG
ncbi:hypothetical protein HNQ07_003528 [Deinococcus metalli]|uniref:DoxX family protein n=1 Tax=Deinococcus metalli TaxID=1141878 RepID=A0A7W8KGZ9_9DEIO|nr:DoxX family protein [Deinococcus metalli]MBB5378027.1 hypothetical protein [Deinococcus metalli]GHF53862.1 hypothetical protein GCM10017781_32680 [Deinococcus metalli]